MTFTPSFAIPRGMLSPFDDMPSTTYRSPDHYTAAIGDILTAATLAHPEAKAAAVRAVMQSYFPTTGAGAPQKPSVPITAELEHVLILRRNGQVEEWEGNVFRGTFMSLQGATDDLKARAVK